MKAFALQIETVAKIVLGVVPTVSTMKSNVRKLKDKHRDCLHSSTSVYAYGVLCRTMIHYLSHNIINDLSSNIELTLIYLVTSLLYKD